VYHCRGNTVVRELVQGREDLRKEGGGEGGKEGGREGGRADQRWIFNSEVNAAQGFQGIQQKRETRHADPSGPPSSFPPSLLTLA